VEGTSEGIEVIDHKKGSAKRDDSGARVAKEYDAVQVAAYALLLREGGHTVSGGSIYYAADRRRVPVHLTEELFATVHRMLAEAKAVAASGKCPPPLRNDSRCLHCSAYPVCLPNESAFWAAPESGTGFPACAGGDTDFPISSPRHGACGTGFPACAGGDTASKGCVTFQPPRPPGDEGEVMVVQKAGCSVGQRGGEFVVTEKGETLQKFPMQQVRAIYLYGAVQLTTQAAHVCLEQGIDVSYEALAKPTRSPTRGVIAQRSEGIPPSYG